MEIRAPLSGVLVALARVPDPVFAQKLVGDGVAIDPTSSEVLAPVSGTLSQLHAAHHAFAVTTAEGVVVLVHVGLDTVALGGEGFTALLKQGAAVERGQVVLRFDADAVARRARSLLTVVVVTNPERVAHLVAVQAGTVEAGGVIATYALAEASAGAPAARSSTVVRSAPLALPNPSGLHARPAAVLAQQARKFSSAVQLLKGSARANAKSVVALMSLGTKQGDLVVLEADGPDAQAALDALERLLLDGAGEASVAPRRVGAGPVSPAHAQAPSGAQAPEPQTHQKGGAPRSDAQAGGLASARSDAQARQGGAPRDAAQASVLANAPSEAQVRQTAGAPRSDAQAGALANARSDVQTRKTGGAPRSDAPTDSGASAARPAAGAVLSGVGASPGLALGRVVQRRTAAPKLPARGGSLSHERRALFDALHQAGHQLEALARQASDPTHQQLLKMQRELLADPELQEATEAGLLLGQSAAFAWHEAVTAQAARLERLDDALLRERAVDVRDVGLRALRLLTPAPEAGAPLPEDAIVILEELSPSQLAGFDRARLKGVCSTTGSSTSHAAILARGMGLPVLCGIDPAALTLADGTEVLLDGGQGTLTVSPPEAERAAIAERIARQASARAANQVAAALVGQTRDGHRVLVVANIKNLDDAREAVAGGAEGVGLLRSEFLFFDRDTAPTEDEQAAAYCAIAQALGKDRPLVVRTLDVGGDKPLPYLPLPREGNPFLGMRGIRVSLARPELFRAQLRAILRAAPLGDVHVMFPMISGLDELREAKALLALEEREGAPKVKVGVMIEVPSAVALAELLAREVDFFSIGTNDLTQYALAMDRGHPQLAKRADALHPAVLRMISTTAQAARRHGKWVGLCGGVASDAAVAPLLVGLGIDELSVGTEAVGAVKACLARWSLGECQALGAQALALATTAEVHALVERSQPVSPHEPRA